MSNKDLTDLAKREQGIDPKCTHYSERSKRCSNGYCAKAHRNDDGSCDVSGIVEKKKDHQYLKGSRKI